ncbi:MAG: YHS domain-containing protein [Solirubrobacterales bacterium]
MSKTTRFPRKAVVIAGLSLVMTAVLVGFTGCGKEQPPAKQTQQAQQPAQAQTAAGEPQAQTVAIEQTTCPVMEGNPINKNIFVEYKGKKVYFCCKGCPDQFLANPEKYVAKLPQFKQ